jgi:hypothetical protein
MYRSGATFVPVWPTWSVCGRQPALVTTREQPTAAFSNPASSSRIPKPSADPTPRPPLTTTFASASEMPAVTVSSCSTTRANSLPRSGSKLSTLAVPPLTVVASTMCGATEMTLRSESIRASSRRLPPQRTLVTLPSLPTALQLAAKGRSRRAVR